MNIGPDDGEEWNPAAPSEQASAFDGPFSWAGETHAFVAGVGVGLTGQPALITALVGYAVADVKIKKDLSDDIHIRQIAEEPAYAIAGVLIGLLINRMALSQ